MAMAGKNYQRLVRNLRELPLEIVEQKRPPVPSPPKTNCDEYVIFMYKSPLSMPCVNCVSFHYIIRMPRDKSYLITRPSRFASSAA